MSSFFAAAAASNPRLVQRTDYNVERGFNDFAMEGVSRDNTTQAELNSTARRELLTLRLKPASEASRRATSHLNNKHERIHGLALHNSFREPDAVRPSVFTHVIDTLQKGIREEIMADLDEDIQRAILAQQELR
ncbi:Hypothetical protein, putative [Bodo saltans]|uniref:Uncharacterized protein n=1 Tax=Bodo saltans TaxID=75058 RepID=A0A0S4J0G2_BODSA|nr:Hypothetical protein, putative [Bodo saltans]|eukprot:CUG06381.1 Hypothetical protein, putative [Bodo saltans]